MKYLFDTSVLVAALVGDHMHHSRAIKWFIQAKTGEIDGVICSHSLAELYSVLTRLPIKPAIDALSARHVIEKMLKHHFEIVELSSEDYFEVLDSLGEAGLRGGIVYDGLIVKAAKKTDAILLSFNEKDFKRIPGDFTLVSPE